MVENSSEIKEIELIGIIVNFGVGSKILKFAKKNGITGGTIFLGKGTVKSHVLELLDLSEIRKEIVIIVAEQSLADKVTEAIAKEFHFIKPNHGIAFTAPVSSFIGSRNCSSKTLKCAIGGYYMSNAIFVVVDKGKAETVIEAANSAGSRGGTIINARGSGPHETHKLFSMEIEPEKEIVLILSEADKTAAVSSAIDQAMELDKPGNGVMFIMDVSKTYGLY